MFVALDFEGIGAKEGISDAGLAKLGTRQILGSDKDTAIACFNFGLRGSKTRSVIFGETMKLTQELLVQVIIDFFEDLHNEDITREIILVCHGQHNEIPTMDSLGTPIEILPITGIIDTASQSKEILGACLSLECLTSMLSIPVRRDLMHRAGNDAHYTLQAMLELLNVRNPDTLGRLENLAKHEAYVHASTKNEQEDWADNLRLEDSCDLGKGDWLQGSI